MKTRFLSLLLVALCPVSAGALETILDFHSDIAVGADATLTVVETIRVNAEGNAIRRGIFRDFPTDYKDRLGNRVKVAFDPLGVLRDGASEPFHTEKRANGVRLYAGDENVYLSPGVHTYTIRYRTNRQLGFFDDHDELYWNVTGNDWAFPIQYAAATVYLPGNVPREDVTVYAYTGRVGEKGTDYRMRMQGRAAAFIESTRTLFPGEGLTIAVGWPKGVVSEPNAEQKAAYFLADNREALAGGAGLVLLLLYYVLTWRAVGKDPEEGVIIPLYTPPENLSPASLRFVKRMGHDNKAFAAALVNLAVKGRLRIDEPTRGRYTLHRLEGASPLAPGETAILKKLFDHRADGAIELVQSNHAKIRRAIEAHRKALETQYEKTYFRTNSSYLLPGLVITAAIVAAMILMLPGGEQKATTAFSLVWLSIWTIGVFFLSKQTIAAWMRAAHERHILTLLGALFTTLFAVPFIGGEVVGLWLLSTQGSFAVAAVTLLTVTVNYLFYEWLKAPTLAGRRLLDKIEGFKLFLSVAEKDALDYKHPVDKTPELFEKFLPYALALDVEQAWSERFAQFLDRAGTRSGGYQPRWYRSHYWLSGDLGGFASSLGSSVTSAIAAASTAPGSSSGGGGGGSSGGGGGGGGGGGW